MSATPPDQVGALDDRRRALANIGPNWFATVMGTSIVATAAVDLPIQVTGRRVFAQVPWVLGTWVRGGRTRPCRVVDGLFHRGRTRGRLSASGDAVLERGEHGGIACTASRNTGTDLLTTPEC
jgi:hypothetical protein